ncbi:MAG: winged helix DNA-binding domain-containing protein [Alphaproteobacteria bacterium]|nr:winged helix DNA-binding domain-containing protein [Alphaproteobacteria bacterium]
MTAPFVISNEQARALILARTHLSETRAQSGSAAIPPLIEKLGYVQLDPIRVVERAHHHILFARNSAYKPKQLATLQSREPLFFENWTHDSSLIPIQFYPWWRHRFSAVKQRIEHWRERFGDERNLKIVREHIEKHGAARARDFLHLGGRTGPWWGWGRRRPRWNFYGARANWRSCAATASRRSTICPSGSFQKRCARHAPHIAKCWNGVAITHCNGSVRRRQKCWPISGATFPSTRRNPGLRRRRSADSCSMPSLKAPVVSVTSRP